MWMGGWMGVEARGVWGWNVNLGVDVNDRSIVEEVVCIHVHLAQILDVVDMCVYLSGCSVWE